MLTFTTPPTLGSLYWKAVWARKPTLVPAGATVPRLEARWTQPRIDAQHLAAYRALCGFAEGDGLPLTYPHVMMSAVHLALLTSPAFPVRLLGLVHVANHLEVLSELPTTPSGELASWLEGVTDTERAQQFDLHTEWRDGGAVRWREVCSFIVKKPAPKTHKERPPPAPRPADATRTTLEVPAGLGRRYSSIGGDINPIHLWDVTAKLFGFKQAIIHGMWSLARCVAEAKPSGPCTVDVQFKLPVFMPATVLLERVRVAGGEDFTLLDATGEKPHLTGTIRSRV